MTGINSDLEHIREGGDSGPSGFCLLRDGSIRQVDHNFCRLLGYEPSEVVNSPSSRVFPDKDDKRILEYALSPSDLPRPCWRGRLLHSDGHTIPCTFQAGIVEPESSVVVQVLFHEPEHPLLKNGDDMRVCSESSGVSDGSISSLPQYHHDTERLRRNTADLLGVMSEFVLLIGENYRIEYTNPSCRNAFQDLSGRRCYEALMGRKRACPDPCPVRDVFGGYPASGFYKKQIREHHVEISATSFKGYKGDRLTVLVMRDDTERKVLEERLKRLDQYMTSEIRRRVKGLKGEDDLKQRLYDGAEDLTEKVLRKEALDRLIGSSDEIATVKQAVRHIAPTDLTTLITGESGTGKDMVAALIHELSARRNQPFIRVNCTAISESLLESELFGHERGAFTGATRARKGKFELAEGGTLFLDEIGDISSKMQASLLRTLETGEIQRVGSERTLRLNVRVIAATNVDLAKAVKQRRFREDLYYRLNVINIHLPPLREHKDDILLLAADFIRRYRERLKKPVDMLTLEARDKLLRHYWPGNVRELKNVLLRAILLAQGTEITAENIVFKSAQSPDPPDGYPGGHSSVPEDLLAHPLKQTLASVEREILQAALNNAGGKVGKAARVIGISRSVFYDKIKRYRLL